MLIGRILNATRNLGAPKDWSAERDGMCGVLPIRDEVREGANVMVSCWEPEPEELARLLRGAPIYLHVFGNAHPVVGLAVGQPFEE